MNDEIGLYVFILSRVLEWIHTYSYLIPKELLAQNRHEIENENSTS